MPEKVAIYLTDARKYIEQTKPDIYGLKGSGPISWAKKEGQRDESTLFRWIWWIFCYFSDSYLFERYERHLRESVIEPLRRGDLHAIGVAIPSEEGELPIPISCDQWYNPVIWETSRLDGNARDFASVRVIFERDDGALERSNVNWEPFLGTLPADNPPLKIEIPAQKEAQKPVGRPTRKDAIQDAFKEINPQSKKEASLRFLEIQSLSMELNGDTSKDGYSRVTINRHIKKLRDKLPKSGSQFNSPK